MATDSTELTFVRCPSCRSLVPAVSTRCRMCGATLDAAKAEDSAVDESQPKRVRQRTMSQPNSEIVSTAQSVREEEPPPSSPPSAGVPEEQSEMDPLAEYLENDAPGFNLKPAAAPASAASSNAPSEDPFGDEEDDFDIFDDADEEAAWAVEGGDAAVKEEPRAAAEAPVIAPIPAAPVAPKAAPMPVNEAPAAAKEPNPAAASEQASRVVVESGARPFGKPSNLSFGKGRTEEPRAAKEPERREAPAPEARKPAEPAPRNERQEPRDNRDERRGNQPPQARGDNRRQDSRERREEPRQDQRSNDRAEQPDRPDRRAESGRDQRPRDDRPRDDRQGGGARGNERQQQQQSAPAPRRESAAAVVAAQSGRLRGWLVSYANPNGTAIELREGKFFVTASSLKPNDVVISDSSISTPHAVVSVGSRDEVLVQDLMSDQGVHVRRDRGDFERQNEPTMVGSGDRVRFGKVEYLVILIPASETK